MVNLHEYLGGITTSVSEARLMSDLKSLEVAEKFSKHHLLKHFSIPRFKAQNIELTIPVAIAEIEKNYENDYEPIQNISFNSHTYSILKDASKTNTFNRKASVAIRSLIAEETDRLEKNIKATENKEQALKEFANRVAERFLSVINKKVDFKLLTNHLYTELQQHIKEKQLLQQNTKVIVEAHKLQEIKPENIVQIKMTLNEEGLEWFTSENNNGEIETKLLPE